MANLIKLLWLLLWTILSSDFCFLGKIFLFRYFLVGQTLDIGSDMWVLCGWWVEVRCDCFAGNWKVVEWISYGNLEEEPCFTLEFFLGTKNGESDRLDWRWRGGLNRFSFRLILNLLICRIIWSKMCLECSRWFCFISARNF